MQRGKCPGAELKIFCGGLGGVLGTRISKMELIRIIRCELRPVGKFYRGILRFGSGGTGS